MFNQRNKKQCLTPSQEIINVFFFLCTYKGSSLNAILGQVALTEIFTIFALNSKQCFSLWTKFAQSQYLRIFFSNLPQVEFLTSGIRIMRGLGVFFSMSWR